MLRSLAVLVIAGVTLAAPAPRQQLGPYFPTRKGDTRIYETRRGVSEDTHTEVVTNVERRNGELRVTHGWLSEGEPRTLSTVIITGDGLFSLVAETSEEQILVPLLKFPLKSGASWVVERGPDPFRTPFLRTTYKAVREEELEIPAGRFKTVCVDCMEEIGEARHRSKHWYSPIAGLVKREDEEQTVTLKAFIRGN